MQFPIHRVQWTLEVMVLAMVSALFILTSVGACGGASAASEAPGGASASASNDELSDTELRKLDDALRARLSSNAVAAEVIPVRVKFAARPSRDALSELFLVAVDDGAVGRVDRATLKALARRADVTNIAFVDDGYEGDDEPHDAYDDQDDFQD